MDSQLVCTRPSLANLPAELRRIILNAVIAECSTYDLCSFLTLSQEVHEMYCPILMDDDAKLGRFRLYKHWCEGGFALRLHWYLTITGVSPSVELEPSGQTPLAVAIRNRRLNVVQLLVQQHGAPINVEIAARSPGSRTRRADTAAIAAASVSGFELEENLYDGVYPIELAVVQRDWVMVDYLLQAAAARIGPGHRRYLEGQLKEQLQSFVRSDLAVTLLSCAPHSRRDTYERMRAILYLFGWHVPYAAEPQLPDQVYGRYLSLFWPQVA